MQFYKIPVYKEMSVLLMQIILFVVMHICELSLAFSGFESKVEPCGPKLCEFIGKRTNCTTSTKILKTSFTCSLNNEDTGEMRGHCIVMVNTRLSGLKYVEVGRGEDIMTTSTTRPRPLVTALPRVCVKPVPPSFNKYTDNSGPRRPNESYATQLRRACRQGNLGRVKCILSHRLVNVNYRTNRGPTPVMTAALAGRTEVVQYLISLDCDLTLTDMNNNSVIHLACQSETLRIVKLLVENKQVELETKGYKGKTPFLVAAEAGALDIIGYLISRGCAWNATDDYGMNAMHFAARQGHMMVVATLIPKLGTEGRDAHNTTPVMLAVKKSRSQVVRVLVRHGCDRTAVDCYNRSIMHYACRYGSLKIVKMLVDVYHLSIHQRGHKGETLLMSAVTNKDEHVFTYLKKRGCNINALDDDHKTVLHYAARARGGRRLIKRLVTSKIFDINARDLDGYTPLALAVLEGNFITFQTLVNLGAHLSKAGGPRETVLHLAVYGGNMKILNYLLEKTSLEVNTGGVKGYTPIMYSIEQGKYVVFKALASKGGDLSETCMYWT